MELMSSLLLCAFAALLPLVSGLTIGNSSEVMVPTLGAYPTLLHYHSKLPTSRKSFWIRPKIPSELTIKMVLQYLHAEGCSMCIKCIKSALRPSPISKNVDDKGREGNAKRRNIHNTQYMHNREYMYNDIIENIHDLESEGNVQTKDIIENFDDKARKSKAKAHYMLNRDHMFNDIIENFEDKEREGKAKRQYMHRKDQTFNDIIENYDQFKLKRNRRGTDTTHKRSKRNQMSISKNVTVNKYYIDGQVYAIKAWEKNSTKAGVLDGQSCHVYSVKKNYPCDSSQAELIFTNAEKKANKRKKARHARVTLTKSKRPVTEKQVTREPREEKVLAESFMTSIEELYN